MTHSDNRDPSDDLRQAEQQLRERERQLESLMGHLPGLAYRALADEHWTALFVSKGIEDLTGYPADEFTSRRLNYADIMLPEDRPATREVVLTALRERRMYEVEHRIRRADGPERIFGEWWKADAETYAVRDYFQVEDEAGQRFWLFRNGDGQNAATGDLSWFLHGVFG